MIAIQEARLDAGTGWFEQYEQGSPNCTLVMISYGKCVYWIEGEKLVLEKGDLLLIPDLTSYYGKCIPTVTHEKYVVCFQKMASPQANGSGKLAPSLTRIPVPSLPLLEATQYYKWKTGKYELLLQRFRMLYEEWKEPLAYREAMCGALAQEILTQFNRELDDGHPSALKERHASLMKAYIQNHYREKVTKEELGEVIGKTPNYAASVFSEVTGQTIGGFVHALRVKTAVYLLSHSQRTVGDISDYLGYCDPSYFHRVFKRETGKPPAQYIKDRDAAAY
ncbi:helix-turn-helix domain-containing protein [Paenibacillus agricola]|uniref:Helix-turn-helix transcriptional regulator n=1 Tax=Paenibacillus agricola TaxID=2716264 RepID=A0ABX0J502_9BACL|nr:AraC family transcriptional regulator [Paenibacillus agricola]NHN30229.1 helix-turn-helix transcriptional regulator [Paenibacillus agricola]